MDEEDLCRQEQVTELELLRAMYTESELIFATTDSESGAITQLLTNFTIRLALNNRRLDISVQFPKFYPILEYPIVYLRSNGNFYDKELNAVFRTWLAEQQKGVALVEDIRLWAQDNVEKYVVVEGVAKSKVFKGQEKYVRFYIWSHHIYSASKRNDILSLGKYYKFTGFFTPGKPAVILIEGETSACESFWTEVRTWNWMKIKLVLTENLDSEADRKFPPFWEVVLPNTDSKHVNISPVKTMLAEAGLEENFTLLYSI